MSNCIFDSCNLPNLDKPADLIHEDLQKQIITLMNTTTAKQLMFEQKLSELCKYIKDNLSNSLRELLYDMKYSGELEKIITDTVLNAVKQLQMKTDDFIVPTTYGAVGDGEHDDTKAMQRALDDACLYGKALYIPYGKYLITDTLYLRDTVNLYGDGQSSQNNDKSMLLFSVGDKNIPMFKEYEGVTQLGRCTFNNVTFARKRTAADGYDEETSPLVYGKSGVCFGFLLNETSLNRCSFIGFSTICERVAITDFIDCDMSYCGTLISNTTLCNAVSFYGCDIYASGVLLKAYGNISTMNFTNCWIEDFVTLIQTRGVSIMGLNFVGCTLTNKVNGEDLIVYTAEPTFAREFINFTDCLLYIKGQICREQSGNIEFALTFNNCTVHYGGSGETIKIYGNSKFLTMSGANTDVIGTNSGFDTKSSTAYTPITLSSATQTKEGQIGKPNNFIETKDKNGNRMLMLPVYYEFVENPYHPRHFVFNTKAVSIGDWVLKFVYNSSTGETIEKTIVTL